MNHDKARELIALLQQPGLELRGLYDFPGAVSPEEDSPTLLGNATLKAETALEVTGWPAVADDTGLEVDALQGAPGAHAARFAGPTATYADNIRRLLESLAGVAAERRAARFRTVCVAAFPDGRRLVGEGEIEGRITETPRGTGGFGYDTVFEVPRLGKTFAELSAEEKNAISHRSKAVRALAAQLRAL